MSEARKNYKPTSETKKKLSKSLKSRTFEQKIQSKLKEIETKKKNGTLTTSKPEKRSIAKLLENFPNDFIPNPTKYQLSIINTKLMNYPGFPDGFLISEKAFIEFQFHWTHGGHPYNARKKCDRKLIESYKNKSEHGQYFYSKAFDTIVNRDPLKRKWCKNNGFNLIEFWSEKEVDEFCKNIKN